MPFFRLVSLIFLLALAACSPNPKPTAVAIITPTIPPTAVAPTIAPTHTAVDPTITPIPNTPTPVQPIQHAPLSRATVSSAEVESARQLENSFPPDRDDIALFVAYTGANPIYPTPNTEPLRIGTQQAITINNIDSNTNSSPLFTLEHISEYAYFWFDTSPGLHPRTKADLIAAGEGFDEIYQNSHQIFGPENSPGIDGQTRIHIVNASPLNLCDLEPTQADFCGLAGYFSSHDLVPQSIDPASNGREMFVMNGRYFGHFDYLDTLAHEFRHMIEQHYDVNDWDWAVEGSAMLAEELLGYPGDGVARANAFLTNPDQQLNSWTEGNSVPYYGQGYLLNRYIYNRLGPELYRQFAMHPEPGFTALDDLAQTYNLDFAGGLDLWLDWLVALAIHNHPSAAEKYQLTDGLNTAVVQDLPNEPTTVHQFAADYYILPGLSKQSQSFTGSNHVPLLPVQPTSGHYLWLANRANYSTARLTAVFDLTAVDSATLQYDLFYDIEHGYDFAYVTVSTDEGQSWHSLAGQQMQQKNSPDDPANAALADRFYTGQSGQWLPESVDLTPFAGQQIWLRFEYVTDPILTYAGIAIDNIAIPEIGFFDDAETDGNWQAEGFVRSTGYIPQSWHLILIRLEGNEIIVERLPLTAVNTAVIPANGSREDQILIVAASAPMTLLPAHYELSGQ